MKNVYFLALLGFFSITAVQAQHTPKTIHFKNGDFAANRNFLKGKLTNESLSGIRFRQKNYALIQFNATPGITERKELSAKGVFLFDYLSGNAYMAEMPDTLNLADLKKYNAAGVYNVDRQYKISKNLSTHINEHALQADQLIAVSFFGTISKEAVSIILRQAGAQIVPTKIQPAHAVFINGSAAVIEKIAALPFVTYINEQQVKDVPLNYNNRATHALDALNAPFGRNLQGKNVTVGVGDNGDPSLHIDFTGRLILRNPEPAALHGSHTTGTTAGGGILDPMYKGMAPKATIVSQYYSDVLFNSQTYITDYNMVLTNNSYYAGSAGCAGEGEYDVLSNFVDAQMNAYDHLLHNFASGNDGNLTCTPYPAFFATVKSGYQCGKNILTVGGINNLTYNIGGFSSRGPVNDGRLKPEIVAGGVNVMSTYPNNTYGLDNGTSMSAPTVTGTLALLYERYRQLHSGADPSAALIKAVACNSADDLGNPGPDYTFGFGMLNARNAVEAIENNHFFSGTLVNGNSSNFTISGVPAGTQQVKVMLYWSDPEAAPNAATALVNNLDLTVTGSDAVVHHPLVLNPGAANVSDNAVEGIDNINNIEQVVLNTPPSGTLTVTVKGTGIVSGSQNFVVAYQVLKPSVTVEYPFGNETWVPGQTENIRWSAYGGTGNNFTLEYSLNNGTNWTTISNSIPDGTRTYPWTVPDSATNTALIRVTRNNVNYSDMSDYNFTILRQPSLILTNPCQGYAQLLWNAIPSATKYEIMMLQADSMQTIATTTDTSYLLSGLSRDSSYWYSVRAINNTTAGRRAIAANIIPNGGACTLTTKDFSLDSLVAPVTGRKFTSTQLSAASHIQVELKNLGSAASVTPFNISYQVNGGSIITEASPAIIAANTAFKYSFTTTYDFSAAGAYNIKTWVDYTGDTLHLNDTLYTVVRQLQNDTLLLNPGYTESFENAANATYTNTTVGFIGLDRCDFNLNNTNGRARTFVNTGFPRTGNRCVTLDQAHNNNDGISTTDSLTTTFNLSNCLPTDQVWLDFYYKNHGIDFASAGNQVWIRGNDQAAWVPVLLLPVTASSFGVYQSSGGIDVTGILATALPAQTVSSSFQVRFGEQGFSSANSVIPDGNLDDGFSFDDVTITKSVNDIALMGLVGPNFTGICNLSNAEIIQVKVKNYSSGTLNNIAVSYNVNGVTVTENIPTLAGRDSLIYTFSQTADLSAYKNYNLGVWVNYSGDNYHTNDSLLNITFNTTPVIASYPYLEGFEASNGYWYTGGVNDSWQWGVPAKTVINKAANGTKAWVTSLTGNYNDNELSYLYSPCFNLSSLTQPVFSFSHIFQTEDNCDCDYHWAEYSTDDVNWIKLGAVGNGTNWYDNSDRQAWQISDTKWKVSSYDVPVTASKVRFRIVMSSDPATNYEGLGIDDVHVFDKMPIYNGANIDSGITQNVSGTNWINFSSGGNIVAAINPNGQNLGNTTVKAYINTTGTRHTFNQYYLDRNLVIQPANQPTDSVSLRFYFLDTEADSLITATGCQGCTTIDDAYQSGITQYSNAPAEEDSTLYNNVNGSYRYILPHSRVSVIPNDEGYYAEYKVAGFSEFWINGGGITHDQSLGVVLQTFTATQVDTTALLQWSTSRDITIDTFIVEKSLDSINFSSIGFVKANGNSNSISNYEFTDTGLVTGMNYYRLKMINLTGGYQYSLVQSINYSENNFVVGVYPNPISKGILHIITAANCNSIQLCDVSGRVIKTINTSGLQNSLAIDNLSKGIYMVIIKTDAGKKVAKIVVE